jgi:hypothetical protein
VTPDHLAPSLVDRASRADLTKSDMRSGLGTIALCGVFALAPLDLRDDTARAMDQAKSTSCNEPLTRTDAVYFAVIVFATAGLGDVVAMSQAARLVVTVQTVLDMIVIGWSCESFWRPCSNVGPSSTPPHSIESRRWNPTFIRSG